MFGGGRSMGGGGGGGSMLRVVGRAVTTRTGVANLQETISSSSSASNTTVTSPTAKSKPTHKLNNLILSSGASGSPLTTPVSATPGGGGSIPTHWPSLAAYSGSFGDEYEWVCVDGTEEERPQAPVTDDFVMGPVPSVDEVHSAVSALSHAFDTPSYSELIRDKFAYNADKDLADQIASPTEYLHQVSLVGSELDWMEPSLHLCNPRMLHPYGPHRVYDAFHLLQTEPSVQRMVMSLSSDKAVWDAVMNNEVVRELRETYYADENITAPTSESSDETGDACSPAMNVIRWIFDNTRTKVMEVIEKITNLVNDLFKPAADEKGAAGPKDPFEEKLRTSFLLSIMVLLIVVLTRAHRA